MMTNIALVIRIECVSFKPRVLSGEKDNLGYLQRYGEENWTVLTTKDLVNRCQIHSYKKRIQSYLMQ
jgi:hypothetical protein